MGVPKKTASRVNKRSHFLPPSAHYILCFLLKGPTLSQFLCQYAMLLVWISGRNTYRRNYYRGPLHEGQFVILSDFR